MFGVGVLLGVREKYGISLETRQSFRCGFYPDFSYFHEPGSSFSLLWLTTWFFVSTSTEIALALVNVVNDGEPKVKGAMISSLLDIGRRQPEVLLSVCANFIKDKKPERDHRVILLNIMVEIIQLSRDKLPDDLCLTLIDLSVTEMVAEKVTRKVPPP